MKQLSMQEDDFKALSHCLPQIDLFESLTLTEMERLIRTIQLCTAEAGETIFRQGGSGDALFIIREGSVAVRRKTNFLFPAKTVATLGPGQFFGEMAILLRRPHSASIKAITPAKFFVVLVSAFDLLCEESPAFRNEMKAIAERRQFQNTHKG